MNDLVNDFNDEADDSSPSVMTKAEFARYRRATFGTGSKSLISKYLATGKIAPPALRPDGRIDRILGDAQLARTVGAAKKRDAAPPPIPQIAASDDSAPGFRPPADGTLAAEQIALTRARRRRIELETEKEEGKLVYVADAARETFDAARRVRDRLLAVPVRLAPQLIGKDEREISKLVRDALYTAMNEAADDLENQAESEPPDPPDGDHASG